MLRIISSVFVAYLAVFVTKSPSIAHANFFLKIVGFALAVFGAGWGIILGAKVRNAVAPDYVVTDGSVASTVKTKVFWSIGFQTIGCFAGAMIVAAVFFKFAGPSPQQVAQEQAAINRAKNEAAAAQWKKEHAGEVAAYEKQQAEDAKNAAIATAHQDLMRPSESLRSEAEMALSKCAMGKSSSAAREEWAPLQQKTVTIPATENPEKEACVEGAALVEKIRATGVCLASASVDTVNPEWVPCPQK